MQERAFKFAAAVLHECPRDIPHVGAKELWRQLARAAPGASNNLLEADEASSTPDLRLLVRSKITPNAERLESLEDEARQLSLIFAMILIKVKDRYAKEKAESGKRPKR